MDNKKVLVVDDEPNVLRAYARTLRKEFDISTAESGASGLQLAANDGPFAVVVSDMRMPEMDGVEFLSRLKVQYPDTVRIMLTGNADQQTAIDAINKGDIFRFLNKPCSPENMARSLNSAIEQHRLINAERVLLENTVKGSVAVLAEVLALSKPDVFGRTMRYKDLVAGLAGAMGLAADWQFETMAMLSLIGTVSLPDALVTKGLSGAPLTEDEQDRFQRHPGLGADLIDKIPRMEALATDIRYQLKNFDGSGPPRDRRAGESIPIGARMLHAVIDYDAFVQSGMVPRDVLGKMRQESGRFDPQVLEGLAALLATRDRAVVREVSVTQVSEQMILARDVLSADGRLLVCKGQQLTASVSHRLLNFWNNGAIDETLVVLVPGG